VNLTESEAAAACAKIQSVNLTCFAVNDAAH
jgi:hypothetical protein